MSEPQIGDALPVDALSFNATQCQLATGAPGAESICVLDAGHTGHHVATDSTMTVKATWP